MKRGTHYALVATGLVAVCAVAYYYDRLFPRPVAQFGRQPEPPKVEKPPEPGAPVDAVTAAAWERAGFTLTNSRGPEPLNGVPVADWERAGYKVGPRPLKPDALPWFAWTGGDKKGAPGAGLAALPEVPVPFGVSFAAGERATDATLEPLARQQQLVALNLRSSDVGDDGLARIAGWKQLRSLNLDQTRVTPEGLRKHLPELKHLEHLTLGTRHLTDDVLGALAANGLLEALVRAANGGRYGEGEKELTLDLHGTPVTDAGLEHLAPLVHLTALDLEGSGVRGRGLRHLKPLTRLAHLKVGWGEERPGRGLWYTFTDETVRGAAEAELLHALESRVGHNWATDGLGRRVRRDADITSLRLRGGRITDAGLKPLAHLTDLRDIDLYGSQVTGTGFWLLTGLTNLTTVELAECPVSPDGLKEIAKLPGVRKLQVSSEQITDDALKVLVETGLLRAVTGRSRDGHYDWGVYSAARDADQFPTRLEDVTYLNLVYTAVTDDGLEPLKALTNLKHLRLGPHVRAESDVSQVTFGKGLSHLKNLKHLEHIQLSGRQVTGDTLAHVAELPHLTSIKFWWVPKFDHKALARLQPLKNLKELDLSYSHSLNVFSVSEMEEIQRALPGCAIMWPPR